MKRRNFLIFGSILGLTPYLNAKTKTSFKKEFQEVSKTIASVQEHLFPSGSKIPSAKSMDATTFLFETINHKSYDKDIRAFVLEGAKELEIRQKGKFFSLSKDNKEIALRSYEKTHYGKNWLSRIMTITMEGLFSDPIYGANKNEAGWIALSSYGGEPRAKSRYVEL
jgi:hypothetical protein